ncbi:hypothetical protein QW180_04675 [Vibrio sinaloensis]|nr:hypothetical protein [Vibrio sinaloensis]
MNIYTQQYTDRMIGSFEVPAAWFQSLNPFFIITLAPVLAALWVKLGPKEPNSPVKFALALFFSSHLVSYVWLALSWNKGGRYGCEDFYAVAGRRVLLPYSR